jgi:cupin superfamily acireductone dioxygenase involved in methionine salvage
LKERLKDACDDAGKQREQAHEMNKCSCDRTVRYRSFHPHDLVYIHESVQKPRVDNKFRKY